MSEKTLQATGIHVAMQPEGTNITVADNEIMFGQHWTDVTLKQLTYFFLKAVVALMPAVMVGFAAVVFWLLFNSMMLQLLGGF